MSFLLLDRKYSKSIWIVSYVVFWCKTLSSWTCNGTRISIWWVIKSAFISLPCDLLGTVLSWGYMLSICNVQCGKTMNEFLLLLWKLIACTWEYYVWYGQDPFGGANCWRWQCIGSTFLRDRWWTSCHPHMYDIRQSPLELTMRPLKSTVCFDERGPGCVVNF